MTIHPIPLSRVDPPDLSFIHDAVKAMQGLADVTIRAARAARRLIAAARLNMGEAINDPVYVAGLEARYAVRAGQDPAYATEADVHGLVAALLRAPHTLPDAAWADRYLTPGNRAALAAAALLGWTQSRQDGRPDLTVWHRHLRTVDGITHVEVLTPAVP